VGPTRRAGRRAPSSSAPRSFFPEVFSGACTNSPNLLAGVVRSALRTDAESLKTLTALWVSGVVVAASAAYNARAVSLPMRRQAFPFLVVVMFAPTLTRDRAPGELVRVAFAVAFAVFAAVECARVFDAYYGVGVFGWKLRLLLAPFVDESVVSLILLDPFSLLLGIAVPVWMTAVEDPNPLAPWAGVLAVGVGDRFASLVGSSVGRVRLFGKESPKPLEGAIAFAASPFIAARFVGVDIGPVKLAAACVAPAACELVDDGVDNFVLPL
jgi:Dolichol kinase